MTTGGCHPRCLPRRPRAVAVLALVVITACAFLPALEAGFLNLDDPGYVTANPHVLRGVTPQGLRWVLTSFDSANWHPLTWVSHMADISLFGLRAGAHHGTSLALHALAAALLLLALERMTGSLWPGFLAAALFALHPLRVESVAWVSERKDVLSGLLAMLTLLLYTRHARRPGAGRLAAVTASFALGLMAKPMLVTLPFVLLILDWWPLGRLGSARFAAGIPAVAGGRRLLLEKLPLLSLSAVSSALTYLAQQRGGAVVSSEVFSPSARLGNALVSYVGYLGKMLWPHQLVPFYPHQGPALALGQVALCAALLAGITAAAVALRRSRPWLITGWLWYLGTLVPVIGLVQVGLQGMADRYTYLPGIGLALAIVWEARSRVTPHLRRRRALGAGAAGMLAILAILTWRQTHWWKDTRTLFNRVIAVDSRNYFAFNMLGTDHLLQGDPAGAASLFARALELRPEYYAARYNSGLALARIGRKDEAIAQFSAVIRFNPRDAESLFNRGRLLLDAGRTEQALRDLDAAMAVNPGEPQIHSARDRALAQLGRKTDGAK